MPQFDIITFFNQTLYLLLFLTIFYFISLRYAVPPVSSVIKSRVMVFRFYT
uniref:Atp8 n=1 Tax=Phaeophyceae sp. TaxID=2249243 RepID=A0A8E8U510_9PHAE|nr:Atp8 [Phaeophyceae sp.]